MIRHVVAELEPIQARRGELDRPGAASEVLAAGGVRANEVAEATLGEAKAAMRL
jgi:hypothetical protein